MAADRQGGGTGHPGSLGWSEPVWGQPSGPLAVEWAGWAPLACGMGRLAPLAHKASFSNMHEH